MGTWKGFLWLNFEVHLYPSYKMYPDKINSVLRISRLQYSLFYLLVGTHVSLHIATCKISKFDMNMHCCIQFTYEHSCYWTHMTHKRCTSWALAWFATLHTWHTGRVAMGNKMLISFFIFVKVFYHWWNVWACPYY